MHILNKVVFFLINPFVLALAMLACGFFMKRIRKFVLVGVFVWLWIWSCGIMRYVIAIPLEREWPIVAAEAQPNADAIVLLGGGISCQTEGFPTPDLKQGADRAWYAARLYNAGKAPIIIPSNINAETCDNVLLMDLGVPSSAIRLESAARNTEENAKFVSKMLGDGKRILLVTSAWHMRRSILMFKKYAPGLEVIPAATDYEALSGCAQSILLRDFCPDANTLAANISMFKEIVGYWGYKFLRK